MDDLRNGFFAFFKPVMFFYAQVLVLQPEQYYRIKSAAPGSLVSKVGVSFTFIHI